MSKPGAFRLIKLVFCINNSSFDKKPIKGYERRYENGGYMEKLMGRRWFDELKGEGVVISESDGRRCSTPTFFGNMRPMKIGQYEIKSYVGYNMVCDGFEDDGECIKWKNNDKKQRNRRDEMSIDESIDIW